MMQLMLQLLLQMKLRGCRKAMTECVLFSVIVHCCLPPAAPGLGDRTIETKLGKTTGTAVLDPYIQGENLLQENSLFPAPPF